MKTARISVMHVVDTLEIGGTEQMAVSIANGLPRDRYAVHLCTTRRDGPLAGAVAGDVGRLRLDRRHRVGLRALKQLHAYVESHAVKVIHAHSSTLFICAAVSCAPPYPRIIWHDHFGECEEVQRAAWPYRIASSRIGGVIAVNERLAQWAQQQLRVPPGRIWYIRNFAPTSQVDERGVDTLPGRLGSRIVCVANLRPQKDHITLLQAMQRVVEQHATAHLILVGGGNDADYVRTITANVNRGKLAGRVTMLGQRADVPTILRGCDIGVLSSVSEGLPLSLIEYGLAGLPVVTTDVGQCSEVVGYGRVGIVVPPRSADALAAALLALLESPSRRAALGAAFRRRASTAYGSQQCLEQIQSAYDAVLK